MTDHISITVRVPFSGDHPVRPSTSITVKRLCELVLQTCPPDLFDGVPQCIVHQGRILPEHSTLADVGIVNGAVLHLMRKPISPNRNPSPPNPPQQQRQHHQHANLVFGHIAYDGHIHHLPDVQNVISSVLQALGFSHRAVHTAAITAASVAIANQTGDDRSPPSLPLINFSWSDARAALRALRRDNVQNLPDLPIPTPASGLTPNESADDLIRRASLRTADTLVPTLAAAMRQLADEMEQAPPSQIVQDDDVQPGERLIETMGTLGRALTSSTALLSTLMVHSPLRHSRYPRGFRSDEPPPLPDLSFLNRQPDGSETGRTANATDGSNADSEAPSPSERDVNEDASATHDDVEDERTDRDADSIDDENDNAAANVSSGENVPTPESETSTEVQFSTVQPAPAPLPSVDGREAAQGVRTTDSVRQEVREGQGASGADNISTLNVRRARRSVRNHCSVEQESNADFLIRLASFYFNSLVDVEMPQNTAPNIQGETAASVLETVYGSRHALHPHNGCLQALQELMHRLTPAEFHAVCCGDFQPLSEIQDNIWEYIRHHCLHSLDDDSGERVDDVDMYKLFVEVVCESLHEFIHVVETAEFEMASEQLGYEVDRNIDFCSHVMHAIEHKAYDFVHIFEENSARDDFAQRLREWLIDAFGDVATLMMSCLELGWNDFLNVLRKAIHEVGVSIVGTEYSVIFPFIGNLFTARATNCHHLSVANAAAEFHSDTDHHHHHHPDEDRSGRPGDPTSSASPQPNQSSSNQGVGSNRADSQPPTANRNASNTNSQSMNSQSTARAVDSEPDLDDDDMDQLAAELGDEYYSDSNVPGQESSDFDDLAHELQSEVRDSPPSTSPPPAPRQPSQPAPNVRRPSGFASAFSQAANGLGVSATAGAFRNMPSFSSQATAAAPATGFSRNAARTSDEFDNVFGMRMGAKWRRVVQEDERKMQTSRRAPLSRGYRGERGEVPVLNVDSARTHAVEAAREVAREARLSQSQQQALERAAQENATLYLREFENALEGRLATDPDFDPNVFPSSAARFGRAF